MLSKHVDEYFNGAKKKTLNISTSYTARPKIIMIQQVRKHRILYNWHH